MLEKIIGSMLGAAEDACCSAYDAHSAAYERTVRALWRCHRVTRGPIDVVMYRVCLPLRRWLYRSGSSWPDPQGSLPK